MSKIEVNTVEPQCGTTLTLGACGQTVALGSGASQTGFGRTGTVDWQTGSIKTATFTAATGEGYFCNTTSGTFEVDLPAGVAGSIVSVQDYNNTFDSNALSVDPNGSEVINGGAAGEPISLTTEGKGVTFVYVDGTVGWRSVQDNEYATGGASYITATVSGACNAITTSGDYKIAKFVGPGTFCVSAIASAAPDNVVDYMVVGAGGGVGNAGGAGGAGGWRASSGTATGCYTAGPGPLTSPVSGITVTATGYPITIGAGGGDVGSPPCGANGNTGVFSSITSAGGGGGGGRGNAGNAGGSGGGAGDYGSGSGGTGNSPPVSPPQGNPGGNGHPGENGGGGGGATGAGGNENGVPGTGSTSCITASPVSYAVGGAGDGGGCGSPAPRANTGSGSSTALNGAGSAIVVIRYKFQ